MPYRWPVSDRSCHDGGVQLSRKLMTLPHAAFAQHSILGDATAYVALCAWQVCVCVQAVCVWLAVCVCVWLAVCVWQAVSVCKRSVCVCVQAVCVSGKRCVCVQAVCVCSSVCVL